jgi:adenylate cyclase
MTRDLQRMPPGPEYGTRLLGSAGESHPRRRLRVQLILTVSIVLVNLVGVGFAVLLVTVAFPVPSVFTDAPSWLSYGVAPAYVVVAFVAGGAWMTRRMVHAMRWAIEGQTPTRDDRDNTFAAPRRMAAAHLALWEGGAALLTVLYGRVDPGFIPHYLFAFGFGGLVVSAYVYLITEFGLRPVAAQALEVGRPPGRFGTGIVSRTVGVWLFGSGLPVLGILLLSVATLSVWHLTERQLASAVIISAAIVLALGALLTWILAWLTVTPVRAVKAALTRVEQGDLDFGLVVFDGTELGELQRGFNSMARGLREREHLRDMFGRHVGREVALAAEGKHVHLGGEQRYAAVLFVDIIGSTGLVGDVSPIEAVELLNRFFAVIVDEVDRHHGLVNKFEGDGALAVFGAPLPLDNPNDAALAAARAIAARLRDEVPECPAGIGVSAGQVAAGNIGAQQRFEYTVIGNPVIEAARLCELAKTRPYRIIVSAETVQRTSGRERTCWRLDGEVELRGRDQPTRLAYSRPC